MSFISTRVMKFYFSMIYGGVWQRHKYFKLTTNDVNDDGDDTNTAK